MFDQQSPTWFIDRGFKSFCRVCGCWQVQGHHWISDNPYSSTISEYMEGHFEDCSPSNNLEYLEWCLEQREKVKL